MAKIGFIGLGIMGAPMAGTSSRAGIRSSRTAAAASRGAQEQGTRACKSSEEVAKESDIVILMVPDTPNVEESCSARTASRGDSRRARSSST
jgi:2-hydroxy-3-oxopropionate reductase